MSGSVKLCSFSSPRTPKAPATLAIRMRRPVSMSWARARGAGDDSGRGGLGGGFLDQHSDLVGQLRAVGNPVVDAVDVELDALLVASRDRVVEADALDRAAVALVALVGDDDVVEGALLGAATGQANLDHFGCALWFWRVRPRATRPAGEPRSIAGSGG